VMTDVPCNSDRLDTDGIEQDPLELVGER
jgi:hypothetical protein